jgi:DNA repair protein RadC
MIPDHPAWGEPPQRAFLASPPDAALLAECLGPFTEDANAGAAALLARFGSLSRVLTASLEALAGTPGITEEQARAIRRAHAIGLKLLAAEIPPRDVIGSWSALLAYVRGALRHEPREQFGVLFLDTRNGLIRDEVLGHGTLNHAPVYPREVIRRALELNAANLILVHNHPAGDPTPSAADIDMTRQVVDAARALKIGVHDHLVVGRDSVASFRALGLMAGNSS